MGTGRKKSRCRTVWVKTKSEYSASEATAAKASWADENSGPGVLVVKRGSTSVTDASVMTVASAEPVPSGLKFARWWRSAPTSSASPTMPLVEIITAANTVSRAYVDVWSPPDTISVTISATSMTVTATARTSEPNGSPTRCATTSAWCTAARTAPISGSAMSAATTADGWRPHETTSTTRPTTGATSVHEYRPRVAALMPETLGTGSQRRRAQVVVARLSRRRADESAPTGTTSEALPRPCGGMFP